MPAYTEGGLQKASALAGTTPRSQPARTLVLLITAINKIPVGNVKPV